MTRLDSWASDTPASTTGAAAGARGADELKSEAAHPPKRRPTSVTRPMSFLTTWGRPPACQR